MKEWILSVGASILLTSTINLIIPQGRTSKIIKPIFTVLIIFVIIRPLSGIKNFDLNFSEYINDNFVIQSSFLEYVNLQKIKSYESNCIKIINELGVFDVNVEISYEINENIDLIINKVVIDIQNSVINSDNSHINITKEIKQKIALYLNIDEKDVDINE